MKAFISIISLLLFFWNAHVPSPTAIEGGLLQPILTSFTKAKSSDFVGLWVNENNQTRAITKCKITHEEIGIVVQMWGSCEPTDCDWGENVASEVENGASTFELVWNQKFAESAVTYEIVGGKLKMTQKRHYTDNSGREDQTLTEYFVKQ